MSSPTQISLSKVMLLFSSIVVGVVVAMDSNSDKSTRVRTSSAAARVSEDDDVVRMTMDEFICGPENNITYKYQGEPIKMEDPNVVPEDVRFFFLRFSVFFRLLQLFQYITGRKGN